MRRVNPFILSTVSLAAIVASPAAAQDKKQDQSTLQAQTSNPAAKTAASTNEAITVTGSRIRRPNLESPLPVTSVGGQEFF